MSHDAPLNSGKLHGTISYKNTDVRYTISFHSVSMRPYGKHIGWYNFCYVSLPDFPSTVYCYQDGTQIVVEHIKKYHVKEVDGTYTLNTFNSYHTIQSAVMELYDGFLEKGVVVRYQHKNEWNHWMDAEPQVDVEYGKQQGVICIDQM